MNTIGLTNRLLRDYLIGHNIVFEGLIPVHGISLWCTYVLPFKKMLYRTRLLVDSCVLD